MNARINESAPRRSPEESELTHSAAHYLTAILGLRRRFGYARATDVAGELGISRGAASRALVLLRARGWIREDPHRMIELTPSGHDLARGVERGHVVIERFMRDILGIPATLAHEDACKIEHLMSPETVEALVRLIRTFEGNRALKRRFKEMLDACPPAPAADDPFTELES